MKNIKVNLEIGENGEKHLVSATFEDNEWDDLLHFLEYSKELQGIKLIRDGGPGKLNIRWSEEAGLSYSTALPCEDEILAFLHRLRPFVLKDERSNFFRICN